MISPPWFVPSRTTRYDQFNLLNAPRCYRYASQIFLPTHHTYFTTREITITAWPRFTCALSGDRISQHFKI